MRITNSLEEKLAERKAFNALRKLKPSSDLIDFCSNDYLGFAQELGAKNVLSTGGGSTGSRLISGNSNFVEKLEQDIATFHEAEAGLIYNSGYVANLGVISAIANRTDTIIYDELAHASIRDALRLSTARSFSFKHNNTADLATKLARANGQIFIVIESIYSMDGDEAPLTEIMELAEQFEAAVVVDEAHATGVIGPNGKGLCQELKLQDRVFARIHTFGKAIGSHGAIVLGSETLRQFLINFSRPFIYTTALPEAGLREVQWAYQSLSNTTYQDRLRHNIESFLNGLSSAVKTRLIPSRSAIQCLIIPGNEVVKRIAQQLQAGGFDIRPILHPTVPKGQERLRICLHAFNSPAEIDRLCKLLHLSCRAS